MTFNCFSRDEKTHIVLLIVRSQLARDFISTGSFKRTYRDLATKVRDIHSISAVDAEFKQVSIKTKLLLPIISDLLVCWIENCGGNGYKERATTWSWSIKRVLPSHVTSSPSKIRISLCLFTRGTLPQ